MRHFFLPIALGFGLPMFGLTGCGQADNGHWLGYIEGEAALIAPPQPGWITSVEVARGGQVKTGDALFTLDAVRELAARDNAQAAIAAAEQQTQQAAAQIAQAQAQTAQVEADIVKNRKLLVREQGLVATGAVARQDVEAAQAAYDASVAQRHQTQAQAAQGAAAMRQAEAQKNEADANLTTAAFNLSERSVHAQVPGEVQDIFFRQGEYANAGVPVVSVLPPTNIFVRFFVPETEVAARKIGERVHVRCDGCPPGLVATVRFVSTQSEFTPPVIYSIGNRERLVFKVEAYIAPGSGPALPARSGLPVEVWPVEVRPVETAPR